jgi:hypothetical protein
VKLLVENAKRLPDNHEVSRGQVARIPAQTISFGVVTCENSQKSVIKLLKYHEMVNQAGSK